MKSGISGMFVIAWAQTDLDGSVAPPPAMLRVGAEWRWSGAPVRVDGPADVYVLCGADGEADLHRRAALRLGRGICGLKSQTLDPYPELDEVASYGTRFAVTDGRQKWELAVVNAGAGNRALLMCVNGMPPPGHVLWVIDVRSRPTMVRRETGGVICFTQGTLIQTETGLCPVEHLVEGNRVQTKDNGLQDLLWIGSRHFTGARLYAMPHLRPVRIRAGGLGQNVPDPELSVSPEHRMLLSGPRARALFNCDEVLVKASDLINDRSIVTDYTRQSVTYYHMLLPGHQIVFANGLQTESFQPSGAALDPGQWAAIAMHIPGLPNDPGSFCADARRALTQSEAAIFRYDLH